jgi:tRNA A-37 threonylcarbamoyl transferase component Bud32
VTVPGGFVRLDRGDVRVLVRQDLATTLGRWLLDRAPAEPPGTTRIQGGRGGARVLRVADGPWVVVRPYRRGGWPARIVRESYVGCRPRPFRELAVAVEARARGLPTAEPLAASVAGRLVYRGVLVTAEIASARPLLEALRGLGGDADRIAVASAAGRSVGAAHRLGLVHADLNCDNVLVVGPPGPVSAYVIDLDRARLARGRVPDRLRASSLARLGRSLRKLDPDARLVPERLRLAFRAAYEEEAQARCAC